MELPRIGGAAEAAKAAALSPREAKEKKAAEAFEAAFLSEMLKYTGINATSESFGGGAGEEAFSSMLTDEYARLLAERGGIGIAQQIFELLKNRTDSA